MNKIHTRMKRHYRLGTRLNPYKFFHPKLAVHRAKTFATEESAHVWAKAQGIANYELKIVKRGKRIQVVAN